jgi:hypothetical protein
MKLLSERPRLLLPLWYLVLSRSWHCAFRYMLGLQKLAFRDAGLETCFRNHWTASSRTLLNLLSLLTLILWAVATWNVHTHCAWSRFLCRTLEVVCICGVATHAYIQYQLRRHPSAHHSLIPLPQWRSLEAQSRAVQLTERTDVIAKYSSAYCSMESSLSRRILVSLTSHLTPRVLEGHCKALNG